jgi:hypothetical protein
MSSALYKSPLFCKTNPILQTTKLPQHLMPHRFTAISRSAPPPKNKPKQSQSPQRNTRYATRNTKTKPNQTQFPRPQLFFSLKNRALLDPERSRRADFLPPSPFFGQKSRLLAHLHSLKCPRQSGANHPHFGFCHLGN